MHDQLHTLIYWGVGGGAHTRQALYWTEPASLEEIFVLPTSQTPQEGITNLEKSLGRQHLVDKNFVDYLANVDFFWESWADITKENFYQKVFEKCDLETSFRHLNFQRILCQKESEEVFVLICTNFNSFTNT